MSNILARRLLKADANLFGGSRWGLILLRDLDQADEQGNGPLFLNSRPRCSRNRA